MGRMVLCRGALTALGPWKFLCAAGVAPRSARWETGPSRGLRAVQARKRGESTLTSGNDAPAGGGYISGNHVDMNPVVHFEMPAEDRQRVSRFYSTVFGWQMTQLGPEMGDYLLAYTSELDEHRMYKHKGAINGGFFAKEPDNAHPSVTIAVDDVKAHIEKVKLGGGTVLGEPQEIPGIGLFVFILDTEGNRVSLLQGHQR